MKNHLLFTALIMLIFISNIFSQQAESVRATNPIIIDGIASERDWSKASWYPMDQLATGVACPPEDFTGRFKSLWDEDYVYFAIEIVDDSLSDDYPDPLEHWWDDDCIEIFIDENHVGENHQYNHNAFAYHIAPNGDVVDFGVDTVPILLNSHVQTAITQQENKYFWELKMAIYNDEYNEDLGDKNTPVKLVNNKSMGFTIGYCDSDESKGRETFMISKSGQDNTGWITSDKFGTLILVK